MPAASEFTSRHSKSWRLESEGAEASTLTSFAHHDRRLAERCLRKCQGLWLRRGGGHIDVAHSHGVQRIGLDDVVLVASRAPKQVRWPPTLALRAIPRPRADARPPRRGLASWRVEIFGSARHCWRWPRHRWFRGVCLQGLTICNRSITLTRCSASKRSLSSLLGSTIWQTPRFAALWCLGSSGLNEGCSAT